jgi:hypothetical protein
MPAEFGEKTLTTKNNYQKHTVLHTERRKGYTGRQRERKRYTGRQRERKRERTASRALPNNGKILQNILLTIFTI